MYEFVNGGSWVSPLNPSFSVVSRTCIANSYNLVRDGMLTVCSASIDSMDVVDAATNGILLDDSDTHGEWLVVSDVPRRVDWKRITAVPAWKRKVMRAELRKRKNYIPTIRNDARKEG